MAVSVVRTSLGEVSLLIRETCFIEVKATAVSDWFGEVEVWEMCHKSKRHIISCCAFVNGLS